MMLKIRVGGLTIRGRPDSAADAFGLFVRPGGFTGWDDGVEPRRDAQGRPGAHGEFDLPVFLGARVPGIDGHALAKSPRDLAMLRSAVLGVGADGRRERLIVEHQGQTLWADARMGGKTLFADSGRRVARRWHATFLLSFVCADPRKYGTTTPHGPAQFLRLSHLGNITSFPVIEVTGSMLSGYSIWGPDNREYRVTQALAAGHQHKIDMATGRLYLDDVLQVGVVTRGDVWGIPYGALSVPYQLTPVAGAGTLRATVIDTYH